jgi:hypothetical protein
MTTGVQPEREIPSGRTIHWIWLNLNFGNIPLDKIRNMRYSQESNVIAEVGAK